MYVKYVCFILPSEASQTTIIIWLISKGKKTQNNQWTSSHIHQASTQDPASDIS